MGYTHVGQGNGAVRFFDSGDFSHLQSAGIVQIYYNGQWGNICNDESFDLNAASVICRQLSYDGAVSYSSAADSRLVQFFIYKINVVFFVVLAMILALQ